MDSQTCDNGAIERSGGKYRDELLTFAAADTFVPGTILARRKVALVPTASAVAGGTGTGTVTALSIPGSTVVPMVGAWLLTCVEAVANGGIFKLQDPNGMVVATDLRMTVGAAGATVVEVAGMQFTITDATDFIVGNSFTITVAADGKLVPFNPAGAGGEQIPVAVLPYSATKAASGDLPIRALVAGEVNKDRLIIDVDGTGANITNAILDQLRAVGIVATDVLQISTLDNS